VGSNPAGGMDVLSLVSCECCVLSGRSRCVGLITRPEESYSVVCLNECDNERWPWPTGGCAMFKKYELNTFLAQ